MLQKIYRLNEKEVKKVLMQKKPFFSYWVVLNTHTSKSGFWKFAIVIGSKSVINNVHRVFFRRLFYSIIEQKYSQITAWDFVFVVKKNILLDKKNLESRESFKKDILFLLKKYQQHIDTKL